MTNLGNIFKSRDPDIEQILTQVIYNYDQSKCCEGSTWGPQGGTPSGLDVT